MHGWVDQFATTLKSLFTPKNGHFWKLQLVYIGFFHIINGTSRDSISLSI
jgi:hypothetical protein